MNCCSFIPNNIILQSINSIKDNNSFKIDFNYFDSLKQISDYYDNRIFIFKKYLKKEES